MDRFSKRYREIDEKAAAFLAQTPEHAAGNVDNVREHIAHKDRSRKIKHWASDKLHELWRSQLTPEEFAHLIARRTPAREDGDFCRFRAEWPFKIGRGSRY